MLPAITHARICGTLGKKLLITGLIKRKTCKAGGCTLLGLLRVADKLCETEGPRILTTSDTREAAGMDVVVFPKSGGHNIDPNIL